jgi:DNA-binding transcriptional MerR regulator
MKDYSIGDVSKESGVSAKQIRDWHAKGLIPEPVRIKCGDRAYRRFTRDDLEVIRLVKKYKDQGFTLKAAAKKANEEVSI